MTPENKEQIKLLNYVIYTVLIKSDKYNNQYINRQKELIKQYGEYARISSYFKFMSYYNANFNNHLNSYLNYNSDNDNELNDESISNLKSEYLIKYIDMSIDILKSSKQLIDNDIFNILNKIDELNDSFIDHDKRKRLRQEDELLNEKYKKIIEKYIDINKFFYQEKKTYECLIDIIDCTKNIINFMENNTIQ